MMRHLTEDELIKFEFGLSEDQANAISAHLDECTDCREKLEQLKSRFASLDLLQEEITASDELISQTLAEIGTARRSQSIPFGKRMWMSMAASVLLLAGLFAVFQFNRPQDKPRQITRDITPEATEKVTGLSSDPVQLAKKPSPVILPVMTATAGDMLEEKPPFAPASAIELVVLPRRENVQLTIYNSADLTLVRESRNLTMKKGWNWLQFMWANTLIDPTSLTLEPLNHKGQIDIQQLVYPARLKDIGRWLIRSEIDGQVPFEITYLTSGLKWRAFFMGTLSEDEKTMHLEGYVTVDNDSGEEYKNAQTRLIVGKVHLLDEIAQLAKRQYPYDRPTTERYAGRAAGYGYWGEDKKRVPLLGDMPALGVALKESSELGRKEIVKEGLSEYFLYTIDGTETIQNNWQKRLPSLEAEKVPVEHLYKYDEDRFRGNVVRFLSFKNDEEHKLGDTPIPGGLLKVFKAVDHSGHLAYTGQSAFKYIPVDEDVELNLGEVRDVVVKPVLMDFKTANYTFDRKKDITGWDEIRRWKIDIRNTRNLDIEIEITRNTQTNYWNIETNQQGYSYKKHDASHARFKLKLQAQTSRTIEYTLTTYNGTRREEINL